MYFKHLQLSKYDTVFVVYACIIVNTGISISIYISFINMNIQG